MSVLLIFIPLTQVSIRRMHLRLGEKRLATIGYQIWGIRFNRCVATLTALGVGLVGIGQRHPSLDGPVQAH